MKITKAEVFVMGEKPSEKNPYGWRPIGVRLHTNNGLFGDGEAAISYGIGAPAAFGMITDLVRKCIGLDPINSDFIWEMLYKTSFWGQNGGPIVFAGISAIDIALWDLKGKALSLPLYKLLGGKHREKLRTYASQLQLGWPDLGSQSYEVCATPEDYKKACAKAVSEGFDCVKIDFFQMNDQGGHFDYRVKQGIITRKNLNMLEERVAAAREGCGEDVDIIFELHSFTDANGAIQFAEIAKKYGCFYFEEPNTPIPKTSKFIERNISVPISNGERLYSRWEYAPYLEDGTMQVIQPDIGNCGGLTEARKICDMAHVYDALVQAHVCASPLSTDVALHLETAIPNFIIHEHHVNNRMELNSGFTKYNRQPENGFFTVSEEPGIGNEFWQEAIDMAHLYEIIK